jgi:hypothetical protein
MSSKATDLWSHDRGSSSAGQGNQVLMFAKSLNTRCSDFQRFVQNGSQEPQKSAIYPRNWKKGEEVLRPAA